MLNAPNLSLYRLFIMTIIIDFMGMAISMQSKQYEH